MPQTQDRARVADLAAERPKPPSVLVVLVVKDGGGWLRQCLLSLSRQTHPRLGVLAVDRGSADGSPALLEQALGAGRLVQLAPEASFADALQAGAATSAAREADYLLVLHDDAMLAPDAVAALVAAAERVEGVGVVAPKVLDWDDGELLQDIGMSTDRFGYPYSPLEEGEIDQGQYDRIREVMFVSSCAYMVARSVWDRVGPPDERLDPAHQGLDFCWRVRVAGFRVLMTPSATARHRDATARGERGEPVTVSRARYEKERTALASVLKNDGVLTLLWVLPLFLVVGLARVLVLSLSRRFEDGYQVLAAWAWNVAHLPGTLERRRRVQRQRVAPDRTIRRYMAPAGVRLRRWGGVATQSLLPTREPGEGREEPEARPGSVVRLSSFAAAHPVAVAWGMAIAVGAIAFRHLVWASPLTGAGLTTFPATPSGFFAELVSALRTPGLGGTAPATTALAGLGAGSVATLGDPALLQRVLLLGLPAVAAATCYRSVRYVVGAKGPAVLAAACYGLSSSMLWALSEGRLPVMIFYAGLPWLAMKLPEAFRRELPVRSLRWVVGAAAGFAALVAFYPGAVLGAGLIVLAGALVPDQPAGRPMGVARLAAVGGAAFVLAAPSLVDLVRSGGAGLADGGGASTFGQLARLSLGSAPGAWVVAFYLPAAAALAMALVSGRFGRLALRAAAAAVLSLFMAWFAAAGYLPRALSNPVAYVGVIAFSYALLVGLGLATLTAGVVRASFGHRQVGAGALLALIGVGLALQAGDAAKGSWGVGGPELIPPAYGVVSSTPGPPYRVLWLGAAGGQPLPPPGGLPDGIVPAGKASLRFALNGPDGASALDTGRPSYGPGYGYLDRSLQAMLSGSTTHGGALLASLAVRFIVAAPGDLPEEAVRRLNAQLDLDQLPVGGLIVYRNAMSLPEAFTVADPAWLRAARGSSLDQIEALPPADPRVLAGSGQSYAGRRTGPGSLVMLSQQFASGWRLIRTGARASPRPIAAFGWGTSFAAPAGMAAFEVRFEGQRLRSFLMALLGAAWAVALWVTRRPVRG